MTFKQNDKVLVHQFGPFYSETWTYWDRRFPDVPVGLRSGYDELQTLLPCQATVKDVNGRYVLVQSGGRYYVFDQEASTTNEVELLSTTPTKGVTKQQIKDLIATAMFRSQEPWDDANAHVESIYMDWKKHLTDE